KYASNAFLATRVSFINEVAALCERVGADVTEVAEGMGSDPRIGRAYLDAGLGFGGPCLEKDLNALVNIGRGHGYDPSFFRAVLERNDRQIDDTVAKLRHLVDAPLVGLTIAAFGLAFKAGTNDVRSSLALRVVDRLVADGAQVRAHDPVAIDGARAIRPDLSYHEDPYDAVAGADALVILTEWEQFVALDYDRIRELMRVPRILDCRNLLEPGSLRSLGYTYAGVGRP
ncbi:MAG: UDP-glucose/GDP-mannose dehydrogenase family protein, partial [Chloroflexi bacterium]|nr:UDP-glucose/GDP-mannose dehydrogenase family protein [Chloroflexota bacterium]